MPLLDSGVVLSRRVKKGPGRRPQSVKRRRFIDLRERGSSINAAAREVEVSRTTSKNWSRGYKTYRNGKAVGFVPALDRLAVRAVSPQYLSQDEQIIITDLKQAGHSIGSIARELGRAPSTISREVRRNPTQARGRTGYRSFDAHRQAIERRVRDHDLIVGPSHRSAIGTLVERHTRTIGLIHLPSADSKTLRHALIERMADLPAHLLRSITWDQGTEMARHLGITSAFGALVYFCDAHSPWQRGSNQNTNGRLRDYFPMGTDLSIHSREHLSAVDRRS